MAEAKWAKDTNIEVGVGKSVAWLDGFRVEPSSFPTVSAYRDTVVP